MIYKENAMAVRQGLGEFLNKVRYRHDAVVITKANEPVAAIIDIDLFDKIKKMKNEFEKLTAKFAEPYKEINAADVEIEIQEVIRAIRKKKKKAKE